MFEAEISMFTQDCRRAPEPRWQASMLRRIREPASVEAIDAAGNEIVFSY